MRTCEACGREFRCGRWGPRACTFCGYLVGGTMPREPHQVEERPAGLAIDCRISQQDCQEEALLDAQEAQDQADREEYQREHSDDECD